MTDQTHDHDNNNREPQADDFRIPASDTKGHSVGVTFRVQPGHYQQIGAILGSKAFPYRSIGDLVRHALTRHLRWLDAQGPVPSVVKQVDAIMEVMRNDEFQADFHRLFDFSSKQVSHALTHNQPDRARALVRRAKSHIDDMPDGYWKDEYLREFEEKYGYLLRSQSQSEPANLTDVG